MNAAKESQPDELPDLPESLDTTVILQEDPVSVVKADLSRCASDPTLSSTVVPTKITSHNSMPNLTMIGLENRSELSNPGPVNHTQGSVPDTIPKLRRSSRVSMRPERFSPY